MRLIELPRPKPAVPPPRAANADEDVPLLADFPTDIPVIPPAQREALENTEQRQRLADADPNTQES